MKVTFVELVNNPVHIKRTKCTCTQMPLRSEQNAETCIVATCYIKNYFVHTGEFFLK